MGTTGTFEAMCRLFAQSYSVVTRSRSTQDQEEIILCIHATRNHLFLETSGIYIYIYIYITYLHYIACQERCSSICAHSHTYIHIYIYRKRERESKAWNLKKSNQLFNRETKSSIQRIVIPTAQRPDQMVWVAIKIKLAYWVDNPIDSTLKRELQEIIIESLEFMNSLKCFFGDTQLMSCLT